MTAPCWSRSRQASVTPLPRHTDTTYSKQLYLEQARCRGVIMCTSRKFTGYPSLINFSRYFISLSEMALNTSPGENFVVSSSSTQIRGNLILVRKRTSIINIIFRDWTDMDNLHSIKCEFYKKLWHQLGALIDIIRKVSVGRGNKNVIIDVSLWSVPKYNNH